MIEEYQKAMDIIKTFNNNIFDIIIKCLYIFLYQKYIPNISGKNLLNSISNPAVNVINKVKRTGAVDKYF